MTDKPEKHVKIPLLVVAIASLSFLAIGYIVLNRDVIRLKNAGLKVKNSTMPLLQARLDGRKPSYTVHLDGNCDTEEGLDAVLSVDVGVLDLSGSNVTDEDMKRISGKPIAYLNMKATACDGEWMKSPPKVQQLVVDSVAASYFRRARNLDLLVALDIGNSTICDQLLSDISIVPNLASVSFANCIFLQGLNLSKTKLTYVSLSGSSLELTSEVSLPDTLDVLELCEVKRVEKHIGEVSSLPNLTWLDIRDNPNINDSHVKALLKLSSLELLYPEGTGLSAGSIKRLKQANPKLVIYQ